MKAAAYQYRSGGWRRQWLIGGGAENNGISGIARNHLARRRIAKAAYAGASAAASLAAAKSAQRNRVGALCEKGISAALAAHRLAAASLA